MPCPSSSDRHFPRSADMGSARPDLRYSQYSSLGPSLATPTRLANLLKGTGMETRHKGDRVVWELVQRQQITETLLDYCHFVDRNDPVSLVDRVFCIDGCFELGSRHAVMGRENLARMFAKPLAPFAATSHHLSKVRIRFVGDDVAEFTA